MKIYSLVDESGKAYAFEIENIYFSLKDIAHILTSVKDVTEVVIRKAFSKSEDIHIKFKYFHHQYVVWEPLGDNSRYWIGPDERESTVNNIEPLEIAFKQYCPPLHRCLIGDILTFRFITCLLLRKS